MTARKLGLDLCNFGYAGSSRTDTAAAMRLADTPAEIVSISIGANTWSRFPHTPSLCAEEMRAMLTLVRAGHPNAPIVILSPLVRPDAEDTPNRLGSTLTELRIAIEEAVRERMISGDVRLHLVEGSTVVDVSDLADGRYPGDDGHIRIAAAVGKVISPLVGELRASAEARWEAEAAASNQVETAPAALDRLPAAGRYRSSFASRRSSAFRQGAGSGGPHGIRERRRCRCPRRQRPPGCRCRQRSIRVRPPAQAVQHTQHAQHRAAPRSSTPNTCSTCSTAAGAVLVGSDASGAGSRAFGGPDALGRPGVPASASRRDTRTACRRTLRAPTGLADARNGLAEAPASQTPPASPTQDRSQ